MSIVFDGELTSLFNFDEVSGAIQDSEAGAHHFASQAGGTFNGNSITYDGINDSSTSDTRDGTNGVLIDATGDYTLYMNLITLSTLGAVFERWFKPVLLSGTRQGPVIQLSFGTSIGQFDLHNHAAAGAAGVTVDIGRDVNINEEFLVIISYQASTKTIVGVLRSMDGVDESGSNTGTTTPGFGAADSYILFNNAGSFSNVECKEMGAIDGTFKTLLQIQQAAEAWVNPSAGGDGGGALPKAVPKALPKAVPKVV